MRGRRGSAGEFVHFKGTPVGIENSLLSRLMPRSPASVPSFAEVVDRELQGKE